MIVNYLTAIVMVLFSILIWNKLCNIKVNFASIRTILIVLISALLVVINYFNPLILLKVAITVIILVMTFKYVYRTNLKESISAPIFTEFLYLIFETIFSLLMLLIIKDIDKLVNVYFGSLLANFFVCICSYLFCSIKFIKKIYNKFEKLIKRIKSTIVLSLFILVVLVYTIYVVNVYYKIDSKLLLILSLIIYIVSFVLICFYFKAKNDFYKLSDKYNSSLTSLKAFEEVLNNYRIDNHENKNHLLTIRNMTNTKQIIKFIDSILDNKLKDNKSIMSETSIIPSGGLRGLIYSKILLMEQNKIDYELDVAPSMRIINFEQFDSDTALNICKIIGIFLDNAIEEVITLEEKYIIIEMYNDNNKIIISITNIFDKTKSKDNIYKVGYSTKGGNHGYGLSLVKKIVNRNDNLKTRNEIMDNEFTQILEINNP